MGRVFSILAVVLGCACLAAPAQADFGFSEFDVAFKDASGLPEAQAGSHPFAFEISFEANVDGEAVDGRLKDLVIDFPPGLVANTTAYPRCLEAAFETLDEGVNACPLSTAVGVASAAVGEADGWGLAPVFNLAPHPGELMRLGFRVGGVANVVASIELSSEPPHEAVLDLIDLPEAVELFGLELQLWGDPSSPMHDEFRGACAVVGGGASCPVAASSLALLTLPTSCSGPLETFYDAFSWDGEFDSGVAFTQDGGGEPMGLFGCGRLAFWPSATVRPTTKAAKSATGLELSMDFFDEGLASVAGKAESYVRDVIASLPDGMAVNVLAATGLGLCSPVQLAEEAPEAVEGNGCPDNAKAGTLEVESPLWADRLAGSVYLGTPLSELAKGSPVVLYAVARNAALGVVIKQEIELEPDPATGQLVVYAEDLPQLPFSSFDLDLFAGDSPLITPPRCGDYEIETLLTPWAEDVDYRLLSKFSLDTGPGGGPCPSDAASEPSSHADPPPAASPPTESVALPAVTRRKVRRCPRGKRAVRRKGKRVCIRRCRKGKRVVRRKGKLRCVKVKKRTHRKHRRRGR